ncbi:2'-5' RNA ligase family protein [Deinococcus radiomollis]|uniref:2'-5' RNA ligase family protein n=1 Tax=Deinococcus radiomollis TaxID=468916 RepID=UPI003891783C
MKQSSIDLWLPELDDLIGHWRRATIPAAVFGVASHISLLFPWADNPSEQQLSTLETALVDFKQFELCFVHVGRFPGVLWLAPQPKELVQNLMNRIMQSFPEFSPYGGAFAVPEPHLTVAKGDEETLDILEEELKSALPSISERKFTVDYVSIASEDFQGQWTISSRFSLKAD